MNNESTVKIEEIRTLVKKGIEVGLDVISNTRLGVNVTYCKSDVLVYTTLSQLVISFTACDFLFTTKIPLWVSNQYDLTCDGDLLTSFNNYRFLNMETWIDTTLMAQEEFQIWVANKQIRAAEAEAEKQTTDINFAITIQHTKNRFSRIEGEEMWKYIDMPDKVSMKIIDPDDDSDIVGARLEIEYAGTGEIPLGDIVESFRKQYLENK